MHGELMRKIIGGKKDLQIKHKEERRENRFDVL